MVRQKALHGLSGGSSGAATTRNSFDGARRTTLPVAPPPPPPPPPPQAHAEHSIISQSMMFAETQWQKAYTMLERNPSLMTGGILAMALKRRAPLNLIRFMLKLNPGAASIPKKGPSPLLIAVQSQCSTDIIKELIQVCPFALVATNPGSHLDPLSYAKRFRPAETDLIRLLSHPVNHWISGKDQNSTQSDLLSAVHSYKPVHHAPKPSDQANPTTTMPQFLRYACGSSEDAADTSYPLVSDHHKCSGTSTANDLKELNNVKLICLATLKGHKRLNLQMIALQSQLTEVAIASSAAFESATSAVREQVKMEDIKDALRAHSIDMMEKVTEQQSKAARHHLAALETNEEAIRDIMQKAERQVLKAVAKNKDETAATLEIRLDSIVQGLQTHLSAFDNRIESVERRVFEYAAPAPSTMVALSPPEIRQRNQLTIGRSDHHGHKQQKRSGNENHPQPWHSHNDRKSHNQQHPPQKPIKPVPIKVENATPWTRTMTIAALVSPESFTYRDAPTLETMSEFDDADSPMPFVFADPFQKLPGESDDVRSLLTDDSHNIVDRADIQHTRGPRRVGKVGKKLLLVLCKNY